MRVLILGGSGMLGHKLWQEYRRKFETWATVRLRLEKHSEYRIFESDRLIEGVDALDFDSLSTVLATVRPDAVINCIGITKQQPQLLENPLVSVAVNSLLPHRLANLCRMAGARFVHISTDCVFSGREGSYTETSISDAEDTYGRTKYLGEVRCANCVTLRTSIIGRELISRNALVEWFLSQKERRVRGFTQAFFSGFTTIALARVIASILVDHPAVQGLYHVSSLRISKFNLLGLMRDAYHLKIEIEPDHSVKLDRSLDSTSFRRVTNYAPPSWEEMIEEMARDPTPYDSFRSNPET